MKGKENLKVIKNIKISVFRERRIQTLINDKNYSREKAVRSVDYINQLFSHYTWSKLLKILIN
jgi:hypothetical protein